MPTARLFALAFTVNVTVVPVDAAPEVELKHNRMVLQARAAAGEEKKHAILDEWYRAQLKESVSPLIADLDFAQAFDRLIVGPTPYPWPIYGAFVEALKATGVPNADERVFVSNIPIRV